MYRTFLILSIVFLSMKSISAQKTAQAITNQIKALKAEKTFELIYDKPSDSSKFLGYSADFGKEQDRENNLDSFNFGITFFFQGTTLNTAPDSFTTTFWAQGKKARFADSHHLTITAGGETLDIGEARYAHKSGDPREFLNFVITRDVVEKIVKAGGADVKIGDAKFKFTSEQVQLFINLIKLSDPSK